MSVSESLGVKVRVETRVSAGVSECETKVRVKAKV